MSDDDIVLTNDQMKALDLVLKGERNLFITGSAGSGKSTLIRSIVEFSRKRGKNVLVCAPTGVAAMNIDGGMTIHAAFGFSADSCIQDIEGKGLQLKVKSPKIVKNADIVLIDEVSLTTPDLMDSVILSLKRAEAQTSRKKVLITVGDFLQLAPTLPKEDRHRELLEAFYGKSPSNWYAFMGKYWDECDFLPIFLKGSIRQKDHLFIDCLGRLRKGDSSCLDYLNRAALRKPDPGAVSLYALNRQVHEKNQAYLDSLVGTVFTNQTIIKLESGKLDKELMSFIPKELSFKEGAQIIFTATDYNGNCSELISGKRKRPFFVNGMTGTIKQVSEKEVVVCTEQNNLLMVTPLTRPINRCDIVSGHYTTVRIGYYTQYPFTLSYAQTIHKAQGQTMTRVNVDPGTFAPGQLYVAISRVKSIEGLSLTRCIKPEDIKVDPVALAFYERIEKNTGVSNKKGRPASNTDGSKRTKMLWVPNTLVPYVHEVIRLNRPIPLPNIPKYQDGRTHMRVTEELYDDIKEQIKKWKKDQKLNRDKNI